MARLNVENRHNVTERGMNPSAPMNLGNTADIATMRARLQVINAAEYTDERLDKMTKNDLFYAIRVNDAKPSI